MAVKKISYIVSISIEEEAYIKPTKKGKDHEMKSKERRVFERMVSQREMKHEKRGILETDARGQKKKENGVSDWRELAKRIF